MIRRDARNVPIPLTETGRGTYMASVDGRSVASTARFVLIVRSDLPTDTLRRGIPAMVIISPVAADRPGAEQGMNHLPIRPLPMPPRHLPVSPDATCFELDPTSPNWPNMRDFGGFAIHLARDFPNTRLELWAVDIGCDPSPAPTRIDFSH